MARPHLIPVELARVEQVGFLLYLLYLMPHFAVLHMMEEAYRTSHWAVRASYYEW